MTPLDLLDVLEEFVRRETKDMLLPVRVDRRSGEPKERPAEIYKMRLPTKKAQTERVPYWDNSAGKFIQQAVKHVLMVTPTKFAPGKLAPAASAEASGEYAATYFATYIDGKKVLEIDIINFIYYINGTDYLADVRKALGKA